MHSPDVKLKLPASLRSSTAVNETRTSSEPNAIPLGDGWDYMHLLRLFLWCKMHGNPHIGHHRTKGRCRSLAQHTICGRDRIQSGCFTTACMGAPTGPIWHNIQRQQPVDYLGESYRYTITLQFIQFDLLSAIRVSN